MKPRAFEPPFSCVLFDVDGTIVDSGAVVIDVFEQTIHDLGLEPRTRDELRRYIGPPLEASFRDLGFEGEEHAAAVAHYRDLYREVFLDPPLFPGVLDLLHQLRDAGLPLATATSKQEYMARDQFDHLGITSLFEVVAGATPDPACSKATVIADALERLLARGIDVTRPVLVGDRSWDIEGGEEAGVPVIGVSWGYANPGELDPALAIAHTTDGLRAMLLTGVGLPGAGPTDDPTTQQEHR